MIDAEGVTPSLVDALEDETEPARSRCRSIGSCPGGGSGPSRPGGGCPARPARRRPRNGEWRIAIARALLSRRPYTTLSRRAGEFTVDQGDIRADRRGVARRLKRDVVLYTRPAGQPDAAWKADRCSTPRDRGPASKRETKLEKVEDPLDYRVAAGPASSPTYRIDVRYPLALKSFDVAPQAARLHRRRAEHGEGGRPAGHRGDRRDVPDRVRRAAEPRRPWS